MDRFHGNGHRLCNFCFRKPGKFNVSMARVPYWRVLAPGRFCTDISALGLYCHDLGPITPSTALAFG